MNPLKKYLDDHGIKQEFFARKIGISAIRLGYLVNDKRKPSLKIAILVEIETGGKVRVYDWNLDKPLNKKKA